MTRTVQSSGPAVALAKRRLWIAFLLLCFVMPFFIFLGGLKLNAYRIILLMLFVPMLYMWMSGRAGQIRGLDFLICIIALWPPIALAANHGIGLTWEFSGIYVIEVLTPYFIARAMVRDLPSFRFFVGFLLLLIVVLLPFAVLENLTGRPMLIETFRKFLPVYNNAHHEPRLGLHRAQGTFPHPILFGMFCSVAFAMVLYTLHSARGRPKWSYPAIVVAAVFTSLSSGAFMSVLVQMTLILWDVILRSVQKRWVILLALLGLAYVGVEVGSDRPAFEIAAQNLALDPGTGWNRIFILRHSTDDIASNPIFGIGWQEWSRPEWMKKSVDNFWLVQALSYGLPALFAYLATLMLLFVQVGQAKLSGPVDLARTGYLIALTGLSIAIITVHMWDAIFCLFMFLLGAGVWFIDAQDEGQKPETHTTDAHRPKRLTSRYTRFPATAFAGSARE